jgi:hypothetical protein
MDDDAAQAALLPQVCSALSAHASLTSLRLYHVSLAAPAALDAVVDAALANHMRVLDLQVCDVCPASAPALARLLRGEALRELHIGGSGVQLLDGPAAALLTAALRTNNTLTTLSLLFLRLWHDTAAAVTLLGALTAHPSLRTLNCCNNHVRPNADAAGAALGALVAANAPALTELDICGCHLNDVGMAPVMAALVANTHLRALTCGDNNITEAFARDMLLPAVRANTSLRCLSVWMPECAAAHDAQALVAARAP